MRKVVIVSFDLIRSGESEVSLSVGSLLASLRRDLGGEFELHHIGVNLLEMDGDTAVARAEEAVLRLDLSEGDTLAVSGYVWCEPLTAGLIRRLRAKGFRQKIVLGGYQVSYARHEDLPRLYPEADVFIVGYAEASLRRAALLPRRPDESVVLTDPVDFAELPSPYLGNEIPVADGQGMVRLESKRGCPYRCSFCAHRDLGTHRVHRHRAERVRLELEFLNAKGVGKINFVDPVFNMGDEHLNLMRHMVEMRLRPKVTFQTRLELIRGPNGDRFLDLAAELGAHLEFGLQTAAEGEDAAINRRNRLDEIREALRRVHGREISSEVSLIYGLPGQTVDSFRGSIEFLQSNGCQKIVAWPLMLLRGTELYEEKDRLGYRERPMGEFGIPVAYESASFSETDWEEMRQIAGELAPHARI